MQKHSYSPSTLKAAYANGIMQAILFTVCPTWILYVYNGSKLICYFSILKHRAKRLRVLSLLMKCEGFDSNEKPFLQKFSTFYKNLNFELSVWKFSSYWHLSCIKILLTLFLCEEHSQVFCSTFSHLVNTDSVPCDSGGCWVETAGLAEQQWP